MEIAAILAGAMLVYLAFTEQLKDFMASFATNKAGYSDIALPAFLIGMLAVVAPAYFINKQNKQWAWDYAFLILLMVASANSRGLSTFVNYLSGVFSGTASGEEFKLAPKDGNVTKTPTPPTGNDKIKPKT